MGGGGAAAATSRKRVAAAPRRASETAARRYHNPSDADAWTLSVAKMTLGTGPLAVAVDGPVATGWLAEAVRALQFDSIDVYLA